MCNLGEDLHVFSANMLLEFLCVSMKDFLQLQKLTQRISKKLAERQDNMSEKVKQLLIGENSEVVNRALLDYVASLDSSLELESRQDDGEWFNGLHEKYQTKEAVMKDGAKTRIKNYYQKTREHLLEQVKNPGQDILTLLDVLRQELRLNNYNGEYFARSAEEGVRICDELGWFKCEGKFNTKTCAESHSINPYASKEARIVFSTWNLDHVVEKSREVLPTLAEVVKDCPKSSEVNWHYFYNLLFTKKNLKLVHVACHVKGIHAGKKCDKKQFYKAKKKQKPSKGSSRGKWTLRSRK